MARADPLDVPRFAIQQIDLVKGVAWLTLALEDHLLAIAAEIAFACPGAFEGQLADSGNIVRFGVLGHGAREDRQIAENRQARGGQKTGQSGSFSHRFRVGRIVEVGLATREQSMSNMVVDRSNLSSEIL